MVTDHLSTSYKDSFGVFYFFAKHDKGYDYMMCVVYRIKLVGSSGNFFFIVTYLNSKAYHVWQPNEPREEKKKKDSDTIV